jgi:hypothetical protein
MALISMAALIAAAGNQANEGDHLARRVETLLDEFRRPAIDAGHRRAVTEALMATIDQYLSMSAADAQEVETLVRTLLRDHEPGQEYGDLPVAYPFSASGTPAMLLTYTLLRPPHRGGHAGGHGVHREEWCGPHRLDARWWMCDCCGT